MPAGSGKFSYGVIGAGRQGTAAAYDLIVQGEAREVMLGDLSLERAGAAASRVNSLTGGEQAVAAQVDVSDRAELMRFMDGLTAVVSASSYRLSLAISSAAIDVGIHACDLGGNTGIVLRQLELSDQARNRGICLVPDCGEAPGLCSNLVAYAMSLLDRPQEVVLLDGGIPLRPHPPWNYELTFSIDGLTNEYYGTTTYIRDGEPSEVDCFDPAEYELVEFEQPFGTLEAFAAGGGSTVPWTLGKELRSFRNKVLRYPGHAAQFKAYRDLGLFEETPIASGDSSVTPRDVFHALLEPRIRSAKAHDAIVARVTAKGDKNGEGAIATVDFRAYYDESLGFTAMQESTGWHAAIVAHLMATGQVETGAAPVELAVNASKMIEEVKVRGLTVRESITKGQS